MLPERIPPRLGDGLAVALERVQIGPARRAKASAVGSTERVRRSLEQPVLTHDRTKIELTGTGVDRVHVRVVRIARLGKNEVDLVVYVCRRVRQASTAIKSDLPVDSTVPVEAIGTRRRQPARHENRTRRAGIVRLPDRIVGSEFGVHGHGTLAQRPNVKGQHSHGNYLHGLHLSTGDPCRERVLAPREHVGVCEEKSPFPQGVFVAVRRVDRIPFL